MSKTKLPDGVEVRMVPDSNLESKRIYSNFAEVAHSPFDFTLRFCDADPIYNLEEASQKEGIHKIPVVAEITMPFGTIPGLIKALQDQWEKFEQHANTIIKQAKNK